MTAEQLPFIRHLGVESLPAAAVLDVLTAVASADADKRAKWDILGPAGTDPRSDVEREVNGLDPDARGRWNNPHNMWSDTRQDIVYSGHWVGRWHNRIERATGDVQETIDVGHAPTTR